MTSVWSKIVAATCVISASLFIVEESSTKPMPLTASELEDLASSIDADTLDLLDSTQFLRSDTSTEFTSGTLRLRSGAALRVDGNLDVRTTSIDLAGSSTNFAATGDVTFNQDDLAIDKQNGFVGVGTDTPQAEVDIKGSIVIDPLNKLGPGNAASILPRGPLFVWNDIRRRSLPGEAAGTYTQIGPNPGATPNGGRVAHTTIVNSVADENLGGIWGHNVVVQANNPLIGGTDAAVRGMEIEVANGQSFVPSAFGGGFKKVGVAINGHRGSTNPAVTNYRETTAIQIWANSNGTTALDGLPTQPETPEGEGVWWNHGLEISRCYHNGMTFRERGETPHTFQNAAIEDLSNSTSVLKIGGNHDTIIDLDQSRNPDPNILSQPSPTFDCFVRGLPDATTDLPIRNDANHEVNVSLDSGKTTTQNARLAFADKGVRKWSIIKNAGNDFGIINHQINKVVMFMDDDDTRFADRVTVGSGLSGNTGFKLLVHGSAAKPGGGTWTAFSDLRLKKNVEPLTDALEKLLKLEGVNFEWKRPAEHGDLKGLQTGLIAQQVENVFPEWIDADDRGYKTLTIRGFEALTVEALRDVAERQVTMAKEITNLRDENDRLRERLEAMDRRLAAIE